MHLIEDIFYIYIYMELELIFNIFYILLFWYVHHIFIIKYIYYKIIKIILLYKKIK